MCVLSISEVTEKETTPLLHIFLNVFSFCLLTCHPLIMPKMPQIIILKNNEKSPDCQARGSVFRVLKKDVMKKTTGWIK